MKFKDMPVIKQKWLLLVIRQIQKKGIIKLIKLYRREVKTEEGRKFA